MLSKPRSGARTVAHGVSHGFRIAPTALAPEGRKNVTGKTPGKQPQAAKQRKNCSPRRKPWVQDRSDDESPGGAEECDGQNAR
jgi:hypothetical protein